MLNWLLRPKKKEYYYRDNRPGFTKGKIVTGEQIQLSESLHQYKNKDKK